MSIQQITPQQLAQITSTAVRNTTGKASPAGGFADAFSRAAEKHAPPSGHDAATVAKEAADRLTLEMMKSALSLGGEQVIAPLNQLGVPFSFELADAAARNQKFDTPSDTPAPAVGPTIENSRQLAPDATVQQIVDKASRTYGIDEALIKAVIKTESNFNPTAVSHAGARGLMQLMPATARGLGVTDSFNPEQNVMAGTRFLRDMLNRYNGNLDSALAAYNWGPGNVDRKGTASLPQETRAYLAKVKSYYQQYTG